MTPEERAESRRICEAATPADEMIHLPDVSGADFQFQIHARKALPAALAALEAAEQRADLAERQYRATARDLGSECERLHGRIATAERRAAAAKAKVERLVARVVREFREITGREPTEAEVADYV